MDISVCMDEINDILKELCEYHIIRSYGVHFISVIPAIKVVFTYGKDNDKEECYTFNIGMEYLKYFDKNPSLLYHTVERYVLMAYEDLLSLIKENHEGIIQRKSIEKEEHSE